MMRREGYFSQQEHKNITELAVKGNQRDSSTLFLSLVMGNGNRARRVMWGSFVKMHNELPKLDKILKEIQELGPDPEEYMNITRGLCELPSDMEDVQRKHKETLRSQTETLRMNTILMKEKVNVFQLLDRYAELTVISNVRDRTQVEHELLARGRDHDECRERCLRRELEKIRTDELFYSSFSRCKSRCGSSASVAGVPGIGKSTMVQKIVHDWATGKIYQDFQFVFSFKFRDLNTINCRVTLRELILDQYPYLRNILGEVWKNPEGLLFIFDGLDEFKGRIDFADSRRDTEPQHMCPDPEWSCEVSDIVYSLIQHKLLPGCSVLVTTRPNALHLLEKADISVRAEILGFVGEERKEYFTRYFEDQTVAAAVFNHVEENEILYTMSYNPSYCWILALTLGPFFTQTHRDTQRVPKTITQLYCYFIYNILKNHGRDIESPREVLLRVGQLAFTGVSEKNIVFTDGDLIKYNLQPSQFLSGFLMELLDRGDSAPSVVYTFPHLTIQEFVAALAQFLTPDRGDIRKLLIEAHCMTDGRFEVFLRFVAGLSSPRSARVLEEFLGQFPHQTICRVIDWVKEEVKRQAGNTGKDAGKRSLLNTLHYLFESQNPALAQQTLGSVEILSFRGLGLTPIDCAVLSHVIRHCDTIKHLDLWNCRIQCEGLQRLGSALHKCQHLGLGYNDLGDSGVKLVSAALRDPKCKIQRLGLDVVGLTDSGVEDLASTLSTNHSLWQLDLSWNELGDSGVKLVSAALGNPDCKIQRLGLNHVGLTYSGAKDLASALSTNPSLMQLDLSLNKLGDSGVKLVSAALRNPDCKIQRLELLTVGLTDSGAEDLVSALSTNTSLMELELSGNKLGDSGVKLVFAALRNPDCKIQRLGLNGVGLTDSGAEDIVSALSTNTSLTELHLGYNALTDRTVPALRRLKLTLPRLERIWLQKNEFSADGQNQMESLQGIRPEPSVDLGIQEDLDAKTGIAMLFISPPYKSLMPSTPNATTVIVVSRRCRRLLGTRDCDELCQAFINLPSEPIKLSGCDRNLETFIGDQGVNVFADEAEVQLKFSRELQSLGTHLIVIVMADSDDREGNTGTCTSSNKKGCNWEMDKEDVHMQESTRKKCRQRCKSTRNSPTSSSPRLFDLCSHYENKQTRYKYLQNFGGKLIHVGKVLKRLWTGTSSKKDGQKTETTTEKQCRIESATSMECELAEEEREKCQSRERGSGDVIHGPGSDPSGEIQHDRESSSNESSSLVHRADLRSTFSELLTQWNEYQLFQLTKFYRERLKQAIEEGVERLVFMMRREGYFSQQEHKNITELAVKGNQRDSSTLFLSLVMGNGNRARRVMWGSFVKMHNELPKLDKILKEIQELGPDPEEYMNITRGLSELPSDMEDVQRKHKETLRSQTETLRMNTILMKEKVNVFQLLDRYAELTVISNVRDRTQVEHELLARGRDHDECRERCLRRELEKIRTDELFYSSFSRCKSRCGSSASVAGVPGIGKSTMVQKIVHDCATGKIYQDFQFVFSFKFRDLNTINCRVTLRELILDQYPYLRNILGEVWKNPEGLLFIFDGLDEFKGRIDFADSWRDTEPQHMCPDPEWSCEVSDIVYSLIQHKLLPGCSVLVTTRPNALHLLEKADISVRAEILGFVGEERKEYFTRYFEDQTVAAAVFNHVEENEILYTMSYNPSYCWILALTLGPFFTQTHRDTQRVPKTITQLYCYFIYNILKNHGREIESPREVLLRVGQLAFTGVSEKNIVFTDGDLIKYNLQPSQFLSGFLMELLDRGDSAPSVVYTFPHLTIQEFVAALAQFLTPDRGDIRKLLIEAHCMTDGRFEVFLRFVAGLSSPRSARVLEEFLGQFPHQTICRVIDWVKEEVKRQAGNTGKDAGKRSLLNTLHYLFESQNPALAQQTLGSVEILSFRGLGLTPIDCAVLSHVIRHCDTIKHLDLWNCRIQCEGLQRLGSALHKCQHLGLGYNDLGDSGVKLVSAALRDPKCKIQRLGLDVVGLTDSGVEDLASTLSTNHSLWQLDLSWNELGDSGVKLVSAALGNPDCKIHRLGLNHVGLTDSGAKDLASALSTNPSLMQLDLSLNKLGDSGVKLVSAALRNPDCKIQRLDWLLTVGLTDSGAEDLVSALSTNTSLMELELSVNKLGDSGVKLVFAALRNPDCKIQRLGLNGVGLTDSGAEDIVSALSTNTSLTELHLGYNALTDRTVPALRRLKLTLPRLERIWLQKNEFSADGQNQMESLQGFRPEPSVDLGIQEDLDAKTGM
ncbi:uncharacterized protein LOC144605049 [Rhinoraja longicauda]